MIEYKTRFIKNIVESRNDWNSWKPYVDDILSSVRNYDEFEKAVLNTEELKNTQLYAEVSKESKDGQHKRRLLNILEESDAKEYTTYSDCGGVLIGNDNFNIVIPNGYGDGETKLFILDDNNKIQLYNMAKFFTSFNADDTKVYAEDTSRKREVINLKGRYGAYFNDGIVIFEKWSDL